MKLLFYSSVAPKYIPWSLTKILPGEKLPAPLYVLIEDRHIQYRAQGQAIDRDKFDKMEVKKVHHFFIDEADREKFETWFLEAKIEEGEAGLSQAEMASETKISQTREKAKQQVRKLFHAFHVEESITKIIETSSELVQELTQSPLIAQPLHQLQTLSRGTADHSVNVSVLSVYLALNMGYSHMVILKHLAAGALLHDIGKIEVFSMGEDETPEWAEKMKNHPLIGEAMLIKEGTASEETRMIVAQHHEHDDGTGYPKGLRGNQIYDLARIVSIANVFDNLVADGKGSLAERQKKAIGQLEGPLSTRFHMLKLKKVIKILSFGI